MSNIIRFSQKNDTFRSKEIRPHGYWRHIENQREFFKELGTKLNIQKKEDWLRVTTKQFAQNGGAGLLYLNYIYKYFECSAIEGEKNCLLLYN
jgi:hypothetical protein